MLKAKFGDDPLVWIEIQVCSGFVFSEEHSRRSDPICFSQTIPTVQEKAHFMHAYLLPKTQVMWFIIYFW